MKIWALGGAGALAAGLVGTGALTSYDVERTVNMPAGKVYAGFAGSLRSDEETIWLDADESPTGKAGPLKAELKATPHEAIDFQLTFGEHQMLDMAFRFESIDSQSSRVMADFDIDPAIITAMAGGEGSAPPPAFVNWAIDKVGEIVVDQTLEDIAAGRRVGDFGGTLMAALEERNAEENGHPTARVSRVEHDSSASRPMQSAKPMVDPNAVARAHVRANSASSDEGF